MITVKLSSHGYKFVTEKLSFTEFESVSVNNNSVLCGLSEENAHAVVRKLGDELVANGLQEDFEPNGHGHWIESLIDIVNGSLQEG